MGNKIDVKKLSGQTSSDNIRFSYVKRCSDKKIKEFTIIGFKNKFNNKFIFLLKTKNLTFLHLFNIIGLLLEILLFIYCRSIMVIIYTVIMVINILAYIMFLNNDNLLGLHGAEHMMLNSYESYGRIISIESIKKQSILSNRCGSILFVIQFIIYVLMLVTKLPIPISFVAYMLFKLIFLRKIFLPFEKVLVKIPDDEQLFLAKYTFDLLIEIIEKGIENESEINSYILGYIDKCNGKSIEKYNYIFNS